jgi:outer membrane receptor for ferrienterochelin and colicins
MLKGFAMKRQRSITVALYVAVIMCFGGLAYGQNLLGDDSLISQMEEVVVTGQYQAQSLRKSVYKLNVIDQKRIQAKAVTNAQQILSGELGIRFNNDMALGTADISLMGMSGRNIKILLDGVPFTDRGDIRESLNQINASLIERIEIVEGPMSIMYGSDALAGVINIITKRPAEGVLSLSAQITEETAGSEYQPIAGNGLHIQQLSASWDKGKFNAAASLLHYDFGGWGGDQYNRTHEWMPKEQLIPSLRLGYKGATWDIFYRNDYLLETITSKSEISRSYTASNKFFTTNRMAQQMQLNKTFSSKLYGNVSVGYTNYNRTTKTDLLDYKNRLIQPSTDKGAQDTAFLQSLNLRTAFTYVLSPIWSMQVGLEYNYDRVSGDRILGTPDVANWAAFISAEYKPTEKINLRPGLRVNKNTVYTAPPLIPSINAMYKWSDKLSLRTSYARGFRAPALRELYFEFNDANHNIYGNDQLKAERSNSYNVSLAYRKPFQENKTYATELSFFYNNFDNLIDIAVDAKDSTRYAYINVDKYKTTGISLSNRFTTQKLEWRIGGLILGQYNRLSAAQAWQESLSTFNWAPEVNMEMMYQILATKTKINIFYKYTGKRSQYILEQDIQGNQQLRLGTRATFNTLDANIQQQICSGLTWTLGLRNILNVTVINNNSQAGGVHSTNSNIPFSYGRSCFTTITYNINR